MIYLLGGVFLFFLVLRAVRAFAEANPAWLAIVIRRGGGGLLRMFKSSSGPGARKVSCVRSAMIEMELDHDIGKMRGTVLAGPDEGKSLEAMTRPQCELSMTYVAGTTPRVHGLWKPISTAALPDGVLQCRISATLGAEAGGAAPTRCPKIRRMKFWDFRRARRRRKLFGRTVR